MFRLTHSCCSVIVAVMWFACAASAPAEDWRESFEDYKTGRPLSVHSQWQGCRPERKDEATALIVEGETRHGKKAAAIFRDDASNRIFSVTHEFPRQAGVVWVEAHLKPGNTRTAQPALDILDGKRGATHVGFAADGRKVVFSSIHRPYWRVFRDFPSGESRWYRLTERIDFDSGTWSLWVDGKLHSSDLPLLEGAKQVTGMRITAGGTRDDPALIDGLYVGAEKPGDIKDGAAYPSPEKGHIFRFALFGDPQIGFGAREPPHSLDVIRVQAAARQAEAAGCDLALLAGDLVHQVTDSATEGLLDALAAFHRTKWYPISGNHDPDEWYRKHFREELDYTFRHKGVTFIGMKTWTPDHQGGVTAEQLDWLEEQLRQARREGTEIVIWCHVTPFGPNPRGEWVRAGQQRMLALCKQYKVLAVLSGHFHRELWHFQKDGTHFVVAPGLTRTRGDLGWVIYDVYPDRVVQHFKPLWNRYEATGTTTDHIVHGPVTLKRHVAVPATRSGIVPSGRDGSDAVHAVIRAARGTSTLPPRTISLTP